MNLRYGTTLLALWLCWGEGSEKGQWPLPAFLSRRKLSSCSSLDARHFSAFQSATPVMEFRAVSLSTSVCGFLKRNCLVLHLFLPQLNHCWFLQPKVIETYLPGTGTLGWGAWCGAGTPWSWGTLLEFLSTRHVCGTSLFPPTSLDGCRFFNSIVVRLSFNLTSNGSE